VATAWRRLVLAGAGLLASCGGEAPCPRCDVIVIAASEPPAVLPPLAVETVGRDIGDQVFERLADLAPGGAPIDTTAFRPALAEHWERADSVTLRFHLRKGARWHDGTPVTAGDVVFSFEAYRDSVLDTPAGPSLAALTATAEDSATVLIRFREVYPEQLYDATWHVRVIPEHIWKWIARDQWGADTGVAHLVGSGPYRLAAWQRGQSLTLTADTAGGRRVRIGTAIWRFAADPEAALNLVLSHEADLLESLGSPDRARRVAADSTLSTVSYPSATYGFLGYRISGGRNPNPLAEREVRRGLNMAIDRQTIATAIYGPGAKAPPGPMSQLLWIWDDSVRVLPYDTAAAARTLDAAGWTRGRDGIRRNGRERLTFDILVPATSLGRRRLAEALQEQWRSAGVAATVTAVDFPVFMERLGQGRFDSYIGAWLDEPSPRGLEDQWTTDGIGALNYGGYSNPVFDRLFREALAAHGIGAARRAWRATFDTLNADAPALFLYAPVNVAAVPRGIDGLTVNPYSWLSGLGQIRLRRP